MTTTVTSLADYEIVRVAVPLPGQKQIMVRGLSSDDLTYLISLHLEEIIKAVKLYQESRADILVTGNFSQFIMTIARDFPGVIAEVISAATDSHDEASRATARKLPMPTQMLLMDAIVKLTMEEAGGLKNLLAEMQARLAKSGVALRTAQG